MTAVEQWRANTASINILRDQIAPKATDDELAYFGQVCARLELDPFAGDMVLIGRWDKRLGRDVHRPQLTIVGRRNIAERTGTYDGMEGPHWCGPRVNGGELVWREVWDDDDNYPYAARVLVYRKDRSHPANGTVKWSEFAQHGGNNDLLPQWKQMPSHMLGKVAESLALRRGFAQVAAAVAIVGDDDDADLDTPATSTPAVTAPTFREPPTDDTHRNSLLARLELLKAADPGAWEYIRGMWKHQLGCPPLTSPHITRAHAELLRLMLEHPYRFASAGAAGDRSGTDPRPDDSEPPAEVYDNSPESSGIDVDPSYRYDPADGTGTPFT